MKKPSLLILTTLALCGCGQKGPLYLPEHNEVVITSPVSPETTEARPQPLPGEGTQGATPPSTTPGSAPGQAPKKTPDQDSSPGQAPKTVPPPDRPQAINLDIDAAGTVLWNGNKIPSMAQLESNFHTVASQDPQPEIHLRPDRHAKYDDVAKVLAAAQRSRIRYIGFVNTGDPPASSDRLSASASSAPQPQPTQPR